MPKNARPHSSLSARWLRRGFLAFSLALGLVLGGGISWAYWTITATAPVPTPLQAGGIDLTVTDAAGNQGLAGANGSFTWAPAAISNMYPGETFAQTLTIKNSSQGNASLDVTIDSFTANTSAFVSADGTTNYLTVTAYALGSTGTTSGLIGARGGPAGSCSGSPIALPATTTLAAPGASTTICVQATLSSAIPAPVSGSASFTLSLSARQTPIPGSN